MKHSAGLGLALLLVLLVAPAPGQEAQAGVAPATISSVNPLSRARPSFESALVLPPDTRPAQRKLAPGTRRRAAAVAEGTMIETIVVLHMPAPELAPVDRRGLRRRLIAAAEHDFTDRARRFGFETQRGLEMIPAVIGRHPANRLEELAALPHVRSVQVVRRIEAFRTEGNALIRSHLANQVGAGGAGVGIAIMDTGIDFNHPEFAGRIVVEADFIDTGEGALDDDGHGTSVAGIAAGSSGSIIGSSRLHRGGVAPKATLWAMKVLDFEGQGNSSNLVLAFDAVLSNRNRFGGVHVVNLSLGGGAFSSDCDRLDPALGAIVDVAHSAGLTIVAASGNAASKTGIAFPACMSKIISVGSVYDTNIGGAFFGLCSDPATGPDVVSCFSNSGPNLDVLAPSFCTRTAMRGGSQSACFGGTSASSPYAAGLAAQLLSLRPGSTPEQIRAALKASSATPIDLGNGLAVPRVDFIDALAYLASQ